MTRALILALTTLTMACASSKAPEPAPWIANAPVPRGSVPPVLLEEWARAENRSGCAPLTFDSSVLPAAATPRRANFSGGWAVAWDQPGQPGRDASGRECERCGRGVFGIAGTGTTPTDESLAQWEHQAEWGGGSRAGWGPEGHQGPRWLAYVQVGGESCLYNVWSSVSREHLESLLQALRRVAPLR